MIRPLSETEQAENWRKVRRALRRYFVLLVLPGLALLWATGYAKGLLDGFAEGKAAARPETIHTESKS